VTGVVIRSVDPQGHDATALLREAAIEARMLYADLHGSDAPWPSNPPTPLRGTYLVAYRGEVAVGCGALRPINTLTVEIRRMFVVNGARRAGVATAILVALEQAAQRLGYSVMRLETGNRQQSAMALYESYGFVRIAPFGEYATDPTSICYEKNVANANVP
jgi:putative acetyltransferase